MNDFTVVLLDRSDPRMVVFISFIRGKREPQSCRLFKLTLQIDKVYTGVELDSSHRGRMVFISFMAG